MLRFLSVRDFVIVEQLELEFSAGFTVLTGETGAGKSILIDALSLALGERADASMVRPGSARSETSAEFDLSAQPDLARWLEENELTGDEAGSLLLRRVVDSAGRSRAFINGRTVTLQQLREAGSRLVDIHGQHAHQSLLSAQTQRELLDAHEGLSGLATQVAQAYRQWQKFRTLRSEWEKNRAVLTREREQLEDQVRELKALELSKEAWEALQAEHSRLAHSAGLVQGAEAALDILSERDSAALSQINAVAAKLAQLAEYDAQLREVVDILQSGQIQVQESVYGLRHYLQRFDVDPRRLHEAEQRLGQIHNAARKYRVPPEQLADLLESSAARLAELALLESGAELTRQETDAETAYRALAGQLTLGRTRAAKSFSARVTASMQTLAMEGGKFDIALEPLPEGSATGLEQIEFRVRSHADLPMAPLSKVASGGELSRISLAIQVMASKSAGVPTLVFDEVDAGIGGRVAEMVGQLLKDLGAQRQVMCVTHLAQVAACSDQHWSVEKSSTNGSLVSRIRVLDAKARVEEVARMLAGVEITATTRKHAAEMLKAKSQRAR
jgi:DNA repair protein RecN (Recombination protein N)